VTPQEAEELLRAAPPALREPIEERFVEPLGALGWQLTRFDGDGEAMGSFVVTVTGPPAALTVVNDRGEIYATVEPHATVDVAALDEALLEAARTESSRLREIERMPLSERLKRERRADVRRAYREDALAAAAAWAAALR
jgi:hypothetical protein